MTRLRTAACLVAGFQILAASLIAAPPPPPTTSPDAAPPSSSLPARVFADRKEVYLLDAKAGAEAIAREDREPFFSMLTTLDMSIRMNAALDPAQHAGNKARFREFLRRSVRDWTPQEREAMIETLYFTHSAAAKVSPNLVPQRWMFIKTDGTDEAGAPYTRGSCIVIPQEILTRLMETREASELARTILHETFHLYLRNNPQKREKLYATLGFSKLGSVVLGQELSKRRITNPCAPDFSHAITLKNSRGDPFRAILLTYSRHPEYTQEVQGLFSYVTFGLFEVREREGGWKVLTDQRGDPRSIDPATVEGFFEQVGRNTGYLIHPEEILADNVAILAMLRASGKPESLDEYPDPGLFTKIEALLRAD